MAAKTSRKTPKPKARTTRSARTPAPRPARSTEPARPAVVPITIVGIGASAGGLEAFSQLLRGIPRHPGLAIVFVQHLAPTHDSALVPLLSSHTTLPVVQVN